MPLSSAYDKIWEVMEKLGDKGKSRMIGMEGHYCHMRIIKLGQPRSLESEDQAPDISCQKRSTVVNKVELMHMFVEQKRGF